MVLKKKKLRTQKPKKLREKQGHKEFTPMTTPRSEGDGVKEEKKCRS